ncbi:hypothetical protein PIB30_102992 [Stylosanthes scabra]|uniref:Uncharacterized protein n=1 Tax=Stylosanthes scabra TaxID=79078 RepID=A0ABU6Y0A5_9FABA|nr:hypothetical protein [Stylosanthes scabra]
MWRPWLPLVAFDTCLRAVDVREAGEAAERRRQGTITIESGWPELNGTQFDVDLNEPVSGPSQSFMALGSTPSQHMSGLSWEMPLPAPVHVLTPSASPALAEHHNQPPARARGCRIRRRRGCGTGNIRCTSQPCHRRYRHQCRPEMEIRQEASVVVRSFLSTTNSCYVFPVTSELLVISTIKFGGVGSSNETLSSLDAWLFMLTVADPSTGESFPPPPVVLASTS